MSVESVLSAVGFIALVFGVGVCVVGVLEHFERVERIEAAVDRIEALLNADDEEEEA